MYAITETQTNLELLLCLLVLILPPYQSLCCIDCVERVCDRLHHMQCISGLLRVDEKLQPACSTECMLHVLTITWRLAGSPTSLSPLSVKATTEGVVRAPSAFSMTLGFCMQQYTAMSDHSQQQHA